LSSFNAGNSSNGTESSIQYFVMIGATLVSKKARTCFTTASSSAGSVSRSSKKSHYQAHYFRQNSPDISGNGNSPRVCLGLFAAAEALGLGFVHGVPPVLYVERIEPELIQQLGISKERAEQPDLYLRIPAHKESIFRAAVDQKGVPVSDALQAWLDVSNHPSRGKEQADRIREQILSPLLSGCGACSNAGKNSGIVSSRRASCVRNCDSS
jgi:hypothetical protein